ncbi:MAG TPA: pyridoxamine 5'-phosphate oxidase family protein [Pyrinomonadaceae bacterium]|nr:pyridoxamine 5'-phosphate oxidase family protein [Pyrinomonadaceae bacterium]
MTKILNEAEAIELIKAGKVGRLGCVDQEGPYVVPINYLLDDGEIYSHALPGKKINAMRAEPRVCLQVDHIQDDLHWSSAIVFGRFEEIRIPQRRRVVISKLLTVFPQMTPVETMIVQDGAAPDSIVFKIVVERVTGVQES